MTTAVVLEPAGRTTVSKRAVERIAARAAREIDGVADGVTVDARMSGDSAVLSMRLPIRYPLPVTRIAEECRTHVIRRTGELTGVTVTGLDIAVSAMVVESLSAATGSAHRRVR
ncbi:MAG: Asp23/Gls24 family envelope stress response protein [Nocardia sp.]|uniref:Asp23/Gls24 family envelope stress response protein n=1 Tax=Nocardia sp. TaxID=1821 RepID=UPI00262748C3|nr:Asp23/Gls24 family envelope stress response protein [Nocardia sp.]MCU1640778.1 Asp23/Gls24 family envelope stress response protein [Nocardia sp.]